MFHKNDNAKRLHAAKMHGDIKLSRLQHTTTTEYAKKQFNRKPYQVGGK